MTSVVNIRTRAGRSRMEVFIGRPGPFGNPFVIGSDGSREQVIEKFRLWLRSRPSFIDKVRNELRDKVLGCYCKPLPCHGDVLAAVADGEQP